MHLGLIVSPMGCSWMRVGHDLKKWKEGEILFFDDSFEHEVFNECDEQRVVFQLVFQHPNLKSKSLDGLQPRPLVMDAH